MQGMKKLAMMSLLLGLAGLVLSGCSQAPEQHKKQRPAQPVVVLQAYAKLLTNHVQALGAVQAAESVNITSKVSGKLKKITFLDGQRVNKGDVIAIFDQDEEQAQLATARIQLQEHQREIKRLTQLLAKHAASARDLDERKTLADLAASSIKEIEARIDDLTIRAPFSGKIGIRQVSVGALVQPGTTIASLDQTTTMNLDFSIPATQMLGVKVGSRLVARADALKEREYHGEIEAVNSRLDATTRTLLLRTKLDNQDQSLMPGMLMTIDVQLAERMALVVPEESVTQLKDQHFITVVNLENKAEMRPVVLGERFYGYVEIIQGLNVGELLVVRGMEFAKDGMVVNISETWAEIQNGQFPQAGKK